jgi:hypothetical protein
MDYIIGIVLLLAPNIFGFAGGPAEAVWAARGVGVVVLLQAMMTQFEVGLVPMLSMRAHLMTDYVIGAFTLVSPWLLGFHNAPANAWVPHVIVGLLILGQAVMTDPVSATRTGGPNRLA